MAKKATRDGRPKTNDLPGTLQRSEKHAQATFAQAHDAALESYDDDERRAHQVGFAALKHSYERVGDRWEAKEETGPSDARAEEGGRNSTKPSAEGVDANASKKHLYEIAQRLKIDGRSSMTKDELVEAIQKANRRASARRS